eukprot:scaffold205682_cov38-Attheya_sp.AAC.1
MPRNITKAWKRAHLLTFQHHSTAIPLFATISKRTEVETEVEVEAGAEAERPKSRPRSRKKPRVSRRMVQRRQVWERKKDDMESERKTWENAGKRAFHNLCTREKVPAGVQSLLGVGLKFCLQKRTPQP